MPYYGGIKKFKTKTRRTRTADRLITLKDALDQEIPDKSVDDNIIIGTWNIREFDANAYGKRDNECIHYIAEIISHFDLVAVQEVRGELDGIKRVQRILGSWWKVLYTDVTEGRPGNDERLAFLYDSRKVRHTGLAGEVVIPPISEKVGNKKILKPADQLARSPFLVGFQAGWFRFAIATVHIIYGAGKSEHPARVREVEILSDFMAAKANKRKGVFDNIILLGDFNIFKKENKTMQMIEKNFVIPEEIKQLPSNAIKNRHYDQIALKLRQGPRDFQAGGIRFLSTCVYIG